MKKQFKVVSIIILCIYLCINLAACSQSEKEFYSHSEKKNITFEKNPKKHPKKSKPEEIKKKKADKKVKSTEKISKEPETKVKSEENIFSEKAENIIKESVQGIGGTVNYAFCDYTTGYTLIKDDGKTKAASVIKLFIMEYVYSLIEKGEIKETDTVGSSSIKTLVENMITVSDNNSTNILIDRFGMENINAYIQNRGYENTSLERKMLDTNASKSGHENYTSAKDVVKFLNSLYNNRETFPQNRMLEIMKNQKISTKLRRDMPADVKIASKTGELSDTENDVAIVFTPKGDYAIVFITQNAPSSQIKNAMAKCNRKMYDEFYSGS